MSREEHKELTRQALLRAALRLLSRHSFGSISLREVTREAGITPTGFYRHFDDMEELGLVLVEDAFGSLREMLRVARANPAIIGNAIPRSVETVVEHVRTHEAHMRFIARERHGGVRRIRRAIERELDLFVNELALDLAAFPVVGGWPAEDRRLLSGLLVEVMVATAGNLIDSDPAAHAALAKRAERQLRLIALGSVEWRPESAQRLVETQPEAVEEHVGIGNRYRVHVDPDVGGAGMAQEGDV
jgi:AcrR family transcriptional regulator